MRFLLLPILMEQNITTLRIEFILTQIVKH